MKTSSIVTHKNSVFYELHKLDCFSYGIVIKFMPFGNIAVMWSAGVIIEVHKESLVTVCEI